MPRVVERCTLRRLSHIVLLGVVALSLGCSARPRPPITTSPTPPPPVTTETRAPADIRQKLEAADQALKRNDFDRAHELYSELLHAGNIPRAVMLEVARGLYQTGDFEGAVQAFMQVGALQPGEEQYHYYAAVSLFETGAYDAARKQLACALPFIEMSDDVARYKAKIEGAVE